DAQPDTSPQAMIREYLFERYKPSFRRRNLIVCDDGEEISLSSVKDTPTTGILDQLHGADNAPRCPNGTIKINSLPSFLKTWCVVAFGNLLASLPDEDSAPEGQAARELFRRMVRDALLTEVVLGETIDKHGIVQTQTERRSLAEWCRLFQKQGT